MRQFYFLKWQKSHQAKNVTVFWVKSGEVNQVSLTAEMSEGEESRDWSYTTREEGMGLSPGSRVVLKCKRRSNISAH